MNLDKIKLPRHLVVTVMTLASVYPMQTLANTSVGVGVGFGQSEYKDYSSSATALPMVQFSGDRFFLRGVSAGMYLYQDSINQLSATLSYLPKEFDASDSDDTSLQSLDNRHSTGMLGLSYNLRFSPFASMYVNGSYDVFDQTDNGYKFDAGFRANLMLGQLIMLSPGIGFTWFNDTLSDHYYGISAAESLRSGLQEYHPGSTIAPQVNLGLNIPVYDQLSIFANVQYVFLSQEVTDSPMVDKDNTLSTTVGLNFNF